MLYLIAGSGLAALVAVLAIVFLTGGGGNDERATLASAGCTLEAKPGLKGEHSLQITATSDKWNTDPPTSGPHSEQPAVYGSYDEEVPLAQTVHNLEHGSVIIHYGPDVPRAEVDAIREWYSKDPNGLIVALLSTNEDKVTLSAWTAPDASTGTRDLGRGWLATCTKFDEGAFNVFVQEHRYKGPERFLPEQLAPGT
jgi:hypothetical protein